MSLSLPFCGVARCRLANKTWEARFLCSVIVRIQLMFFDQSYKIKICGVLVLLAGHVIIRPIATIELGVTSLVKHV